MCWVNCTYTPKPKGNTNIGQRLFYLWLAVRIKPVLHMDDTSISTSYFRYMGVSDTLPFGKFYAGEAITLTSNWLGLVIFFSLGFIFFPSNMKQHRSLPSKKVLVLEIDKANDHTNHKGSRSAKDSAWHFKTGWVGTVGWPFEGWYANGVLVLRTRNGA